MKIALVCKVYPTQRPGGMAFVCQDRARALVAGGHEVHVLTTGKDGHLGATLQDQGVEVHHMPCKSEYYSTEFAQHCVTHCKQFAPEILHLDSYDSDRQWWLDRPGKPKRIAVTMHGFGWGAYFTQWNIWARHGGPPPILNVDSMAREYGILHTFDRVIGISIHEHWMLQDLVGLYDAKLVYNPIADMFFEPPLQSLPDPPRYLCAAVSGYRERGFDIAMEAAELAGVELDTFRSATREQVAAEMGKYTGLVLPTCYAQGCDLAVGEMLAKRRIVIATATGSYLREAQPGGAYRGAIQLVPLRDVRALAEAMKNPIRYDETEMYLRTNRHRPAVHVRKWLEVME